MWFCIRCLTFSRFDDGLANMPIHLTQKYVTLLCKSLYYIHIIKGARGLYYLESVFGNSFTHIFMLT